jgi:hypothetical protein
VSNVGTDKSQLANMANQAKAALEAESLEAFADRGYFKGEEILACEEASITVTLPKPQKRLKALEDENAKLKRLLAEAMLDNAMLKDARPSLICAACSR